MATIISHSPEETYAFGRKCAAETGNGEIYALDGDLGAGKTHFVKGLVAGLGYTDEVTSPTFTLMHEYQCPQWPVFHFDFYRLKSEREVFELDFEGYLEGGGVIVVEWASKFREWFPPETRWIRFEVGEGDERRIVEEEQ